MMMRIIIIIIINYLFYHFTLFGFIDVSITVKQLVIFIILLSIPNTWTEAIWFNLECCNQEEGFHIVKKNKKVSVQYLGCSKLVQFRIYVL